MGSKEDAIEEQKRRRHINEKVVRLLSSKWATNILGALLVEPKRFSELEKLFYISPRVLTDTLRLLESYNLITRNVYLTVPVTVEYQISEAGIAFKEMVLMSMQDWWDEWGNDELLKNETMYQYKHKID